MLLTVIGNRPQMIKMAPVSAEIMARGLDEHIVHTNQHYDHAMSGVFFEQLGIPAPKTHLTIEGRSHARMTAEIMVQLEDRMLELKPRGVLIYGDTNSTLAACLAAAKLNIPIAHVEAGPRTGDMTMPEEVNRLPADHLSTLRFCTDEISVKNLKRENITKGVFLTGDLMYDAFKRFSPLAANDASGTALLEKMGGRPFVFMTIHRPVNTDARDALERLIALIEASPLPVLFAVHPRTTATIEKYGLTARVAGIKHLTTTAPLSYFETLAALNACAFVATDSGGLQKEAYWAGKQAFLAQDVSPWPQLVGDGWIKCIGAFDKDLPANIWEIMTTTRSDKPQAPYFGDGRAAARIVDALVENHLF